MNNLDEGQIKKLLDETFDKIKSMTDQDTKKLSDLNNGLNWILTFTTIFFVFFYRTEADSASKKDEYFLLAYKVIFLLLVATLIIHKIFYVKYEDFKGAYLGALHSHRIDLLFTYPAWKEKLEKIAPYSTITFHNSFRNGEFLYHSAQEISRQELRALDSKISISANWIKGTYYIGLVLFAIDFVLVGIALLN
jgi:hypothetical protein